MKRAILALAALALTLGTISEASAYDRYHHHRVCHMERIHHHWVKRCR